MAVNSWSSLIDSFEPKLRTAFIQSIYNIRDQAQLDHIVRMLEAGDIDGALRAVGLDPAQFRGFDKAIADAFEAGGNATATALPVAIAPDGIRTVFQFNVRNLDAEAWLRDYSSRLVTDIMDDQRQMIRNVLQDGLSKGANPQTTALDLVGRVNKASGHREGGLIGLTDSQAQWVKNYTDELTGDNPVDALKRTLRDKRFDRTVMNAVEEDRLLTADEIARMVTSYRNRALKLRADTIARKETITALHTAQDQSITQAINARVVQPDNLTYVWRSAHDDRVRLAHQVLDGQVAKQGQPFQSILGPIRFPGDPLASPENTINCRCFREPRVDFLAGLK